MYTTKQVNNFIKLRAQNYSYDRLSVMLYIPKRTLIRWGKEKAGEIEMLKNSTFEALFKTLNVTVAQRISMLAKDLKRINKDLKSRPIGSPVSVELFKLKMKLITELSKFDTALNHDIECDGGEFQTNSDVYDDHENEDIIHEFDSDEDEAKFNQDVREREMERQKIRDENPGISEDMIDKIEFERVRRDDLSPIKKDD